MVVPGVRTAVFSTLAADAVPASAAEPVRAASAATAALRRRVVVRYIVVSCESGRDVVDDATTSPACHAWCPPAAGAGTPRPPPAPRAAARRGSPRRALTVSYAHIATRITVTAPASAHAARSPPTA